MKDNDHHRYRLNIDEAKSELYREVTEIDSNEFTYIYLFGFDYEDRLICGYVLNPDDPPSALELIISLAEKLSIDYGTENIYFIIKLKGFKFDDNDMRQRHKAYTEGFIDMTGTMERARGFIRAWKEFEKSKGGMIPALKRYTIEFVNHTLGLPFRYSEDQRNMDIQELFPKKKWWQWWR